MSEETNEKKVLSEDEVKALLKKRVDLMTANLPALRIQDEYSRLKANIAENTFREEMSRMQHAKLKMPPEPEAEDGAPIPPEKTKE